MRTLLLAVADGGLGEAELRGVAHIFDGLLYDLECATGEIDPA